jgi:hypothetical protein
MDRRICQPFGPLVVLVIVGACAGPKMREKAAESPPVASSPSPPKLEAPTASAKKPSVTECHGLWSRAAAALREIETQHAACTSDGDCVLVKGGVCLPGWCDIAIAKSGAGAHRATLERIAGSECASWTGGDCQTTTPMEPVTTEPRPPCPYVVPRCIGNRCAPGKP